MMRFTLWSVLVVVLLAASLSDVSVEAASRKSHRKPKHKNPEKPPSVLPTVVLPLPTAPTRSLKLGFYRGTACSNVEDVVRAEVKKEFDVNPGIAALLLRIYFHDCFADGRCDASLLINKNKNGALRTELDAGANEGIRGLAFIDALKRAVVAACAGRKDLVSCADIIALAVRDAVALAANRPRYPIKTGRLDGKVSLMANAQTLPGSRQSIASIVARFQQEGFTPEETVVLSGAHSVGQARCKFFDDRMYNWRGTGRPDPTMNPATASQLRRTCPNTTPSSGNRVFLDQGPGSAFILDKSYYTMLTQHRGVMESDQKLLTDPLTRAFVPPLALGPESNFMSKFEAALIKMGNLGALQSAGGDIRRVCSVLN